VPGNNPLICQFHGCEGYPFCPAVATSIYPCFIVAGIVACWAGHTLSNFNGVRATKTPGLRRVFLSVEMETSLF